MAERYDEAKLRKTLDTLQGAVKLRKFRKLDFFKPYKKQREFIAETGEKREMLLMAANRVGKSEIGAFIAATHLTGEYPKWWRGRRFEHPTTGWAAGETSLVTRDVQQRKLFGPPGVEADFGSGMVPREAIVDFTMARGISDAFDTVQVKHKLSGGISTIAFKSYEQGRRKFQGEGLDFGWGDEEPPEDVYAEMVARMAPTTEKPTGGHVFITFTPLLGRTAVVMRFIDQPSADRGMISMELEDAEHIDEQARIKILDGYLPHEREARARGVPLLGSGKVFSVPPENFMEDPMEFIPPYWRKLWGIDFGIGHPFAAVLGIHDADNDVLHVHSTIREKDQLVLQHVQAMQRIGTLVPVAWPHDGTQRDRRSGEQIARIYKKEGLLMLPDHSTFEDGGYSLEAGVFEIDNRIKSGRLKVGKHLTDFFEEYRLYHRKDSVIVPIMDDILSALRQIIMMLRFARAVGLGFTRNKKRMSPIASDVDFDLF